MLCTNFLHSRVGETDGVDHSALELGDTRSTRAVAAFDAHRFGDKSAKRVKFDHVGQLATVGGGAGGQQNRILEIDPRGGNCERGRRHRYRWPPTRDS